MPISHNKKACSNINISKPDLLFTWLSDRNTYNMVVKLQFIYGNTTSICFLSYCVLAQNKTLANLLRIVKVGVKVALALLARYNVQM
jgi:hypothetical protein